MTEVPRLYLEGDEDGKKWVAEIVGGDPKFRLKRSFLPERSGNEFVLYDGVYQIYGQHPGISPFNKEYCLVEDGQMTRRIPYQTVLQWVPQIESRKDTRLARLRQEIHHEFENIYEAVPEDFVYEAIQQQKEGMEWVEEEDDLRQGLRWLLKQQTQMIQQFKEQSERMKKDDFWAE